ncbi:MAG: glycerate kinase type-2 family protein [Acidobacteriota bacterium]
MLAIARGAIDGASSSRAVARALESSDLGSLDRPVHILAAGKAAGAMASEAARVFGDRAATIVAVGTHRPKALAGQVEWREAGHPLPDERSVAAGERALELAASVPPEGHLLLLLSGGASALLAMPAPGITLDDKRRTIDGMMRAGADIQALNTVRKHLSSLKGGRLARRCRGRTTTLALSDVLDDDVSVIGSGPGVADASTWADAQLALAMWSSHPHPAAVTARVSAGMAGLLEDTPKPGSPGVSRAAGRIIGSRRDALIGASDVAAGRGYRVTVLDQPIHGEARDAAPRWLGAALAAAERSAGRTCVLSAGETTVRVTGAGKGGRNQEFVLALAETVSRLGRRVVIASIGTDGIDGPTDAAGAVVDPGTVDRAGALGLAAPRVYLDGNDSYAFFEALGDLVDTGPTDTNVGDIQIMLAAPLEGEDSRHVGPA